MSSAAPRRGERERAEAPARVLVVDDEPLIRLSVGRRFEDEGFVVHTAGDGAAALRAFEEEVDAVVLDVRLPDVNGIALMRRMREIDSSIPVILLTGHSAVPQAVAAMQEGAFHYGRKPFELDRLTEVVKSALQKSRLPRHVRELRRQAGCDGPLLLGESLAIRRVRATVQRFAESASSTVLIQGESGTGKGVVAGLLHAMSSRADAPFVNVTCSALPSGLLESELFGHEKGAFTSANERKRGLVEIASGGTLFLDEIGELPLRLQAKLLRFLQDKTFRRVGGTVDIQADVRIVAATNRDLEEAVRTACFRADLFYRLSVLAIVLPPLRDRPGDAPLLAEHFLQRFAGELDRAPKTLESDAREWLDHYPWPGNVRELRNVLERAVLTTKGGALGVPDLVVRRPAGAAEEHPFELPPQGVNLPRVATQLVAQALERAEGNRTAAGRLLGLNRDQVRYRIQKHGLEDPDGSGES